jgi:hypothetical protein
MSRLAHLSSTDNPRARPLDADLSLAGPRRGEVEVRVIDHDSARYGYFADAKALTAPVWRTAGASRGTHGVGIAYAVGLHLD